MDVFLPACLLLEHFLQTCKMIIDGRMFGSLACFLDSNQSVFEKLVTMILQHTPLRMQSINAFAWSVHGPILVTSFVAAQQLSIARVSAAHGVSKRATEL